MASLSTRHGRDDETSPRSRVRSGWGRWHLRILSLSELAAFLSGLHVQPLLAILTVRKLAPLFVSGRFLSTLGELGAPWHGLASQLTTL